MGKFLDQLPIPLLVMGSLTLGLAPFVPIPHLIEKVLMLARGELSQPIDIFDLVMHGAPVALLLAKLARTALVKRPA